MTHFAHYIEKILWGLMGFGVMLVLFYAALHILRTQAAQIPVVGSPVASGATWVAAHSQNY